MRIVGARPGMVVVVRWGRAECGCEWTGAGAGVGVGVGEGCSAGDDSCRSSRDGVPGF